MKLRLPLLKSSVFALAMLCLSLQTHAVLILELQASGYNPSTGVWTATAGPNATAIGTPSTLGIATPNNSPTVNFNGNNVFSLATFLPGGTPYTIFVFTQISSIGSALTVAGGEGGGFQYRINSGKQDTLSQGVADLGSSTTALSTTSFSNINATVSSTGGTYRLNGAADGTNGGSSFSGSIKNIGSNTGGGGGEPFQGSIAEIRIYNTVLTDTERQAVEAEFTSSYVTPVPEPSSWVMMMGGFGMLIGFQRIRSARA